jgi:hypothetical protein
MQHSSRIQMRSLLKKNATMTVRKRKDFCRECFFIFMLGVLIFLRAQFKTVDFPAKLDFPVHSLDLTSGAAAHFSPAAIEELKAKPEIGVAPSLPLTRCQRGNHQFRTSFCVFITWCCTVAHDLKCSHKNR